MMFHSGLACQFWIHECLTHQLAVKLTTDQCSKEYSTFHRRWLETGSLARHWEDAADEFGFGEGRGGKTPSSLPPQKKNSTTPKKTKKKNKEK